MRFLKEPPQVTTVRLWLRAGFRGQDQYAVGDLSSKLMPLLPDLQATSLGQQLQLQLWDMFLPVQGPRSVVHRTFVIHK